MGKIYYSSLKIIQAYFEDESLDQSSLKKLLLGPGNFINQKEKKLYFEEAESLVLGSLVDAKITNTKEDFDKQFYVSELVTKPSDVIMSIINKVYDDISYNFPNEEIKDLPDYTDLIHEAALAHNYQPTYKPDTRIGKILEHSYYFDEIKNCKGRKIISLEEDSVSNCLVDSLKSHYNILGFLEDFETNPAFQDCELYFQLPIYFGYEDLSCKALPDILLVNSESKTVHIIDIKTTALRTIEFPTAVSKFRYDIQLAFYTLAVQILYPSYSIKQGFVVESTTSPGNPILYKATKGLIDKGLEGRESLIVDGVVVRGRQKGIKDLISDFKYYQENGFMCERVIAENSNELFLSENGLIVGV